MGYLELSNMFDLPFLENQNSISNYAHCAQLVLLPPDIVANFLNVITTPSHLTQPFTLQQPFIMYWSTPFLIFTAFPMHTFTCCLWFNCPQQKFNTAVKQPLIIQKWHDLYNDYKFDPSHAMHTHTHTQWIISMHC